MIATKLRRQRGIAAVELALVLPVLLVLLAMPLMFGRVFWHYTVAQKAAQDGVRYLATIPLSEMRSPLKVAYSVAVAQAIVDQELAGLNPGEDAIAVSINCDGVTCNGLVVPSAVSIQVQMRVYDIFIAEYTRSAIGSEGMVLTAMARMRYAPN